MTTPLTLESQPARRFGRSVIAMVAAVVANVVLSLATDQLLHVLAVYPPWGQPMYEPALNALALSYRIVYGVLGGAIVAHLAPRAAMRHAMILGVIGTAVATAGAVVTITQYDLGPSWYPIALAVAALPTTWLGAKWEERRRRA
jgi:hypothetical protein